MERYFQSGHDIELYSFLVKNEKHINPGVLKELYERLSKTTCDKLETLFAKPNFLQNFTAMKEWLSKNPSPDELKLAQAVIEKVFHAKDLSYFETYAPIGSANVQAFAHAIIHGRNFLQNFTDDPKLKDLLDSEALFQVLKLIDQQNPFRSQGLEPIEHDGNIGKTLERELPFIINQKQALELLALCKKKTEEFDPAYLTYEDIEANIKERFTK